MADISKKQNDVKVSDESIEEVPVNKQKKSNNLKELTSITNVSNNNENMDQEEETNKIIHIPTKENVSLDAKPINFGHQNSSFPNLMDNISKRSMCTDQTDDEKYTLFKSDIDSDEDCSKRQKLNECLPNTSSNNLQENDIKKIPNFRKLESKFKQRNYRSQSNSSDITDDINEQTQSHESAHEESSSSDSIQFQGSIRERFTDSSDERNETPEDNSDSNEWTTASEDDEDKIPAVLQKEPSKSDWSIIKDIVNRQIGFNNSIHHRFYSSLHAVQRLELMYKLEDHLGCVNALSFNQKGNLLASASDDLRINIWDWAVGKKFRTLHSRHQSNIFQSKWLPPDIDYFIVSSARDGQVRLIDVQTNISRILAHHRAACHKISTHLDLPHIVLSAGEDSKVLCIDIREYKPTKLLSVTDDDEEVELYSIHSNPLNSFEFCVAGRTRSVKIYDRRKPNIPLYELCPKHLIHYKACTCAVNSITCAVYNHNGTEIIASYDNEDIYLFDITTSYQRGDFAHRYQGHRNSATVKGVNFFGPNSQFILSGSDCGNIFIWDKKTEAIVQWMAGDEQGIVNVLEPHPNIPVLATGGLDYDVKIWIPSREETPDIKRQLQSFLLARRRNGNQNNISDGDLDIDINDDDENDSDTSTSSNNSSVSDNHSES